MMSTTTPRRKKPAATAVIAMSALMVGIAAADSALAQQPARGTRRAPVAQGPLINRVAIEGNKRVEKAQIEANRQAADGCTARIRSTGSCVERDSARRRGTRATADARRTGTARTGRASITAGAQAADAAVTAGRGAAAGDC